MVVMELKSTSHIDGNRIDLSWKNPSLEEWPEFAGVQVVRNERVFPINETDGEVLFLEESKQEFISDTGLKGETVYYYTVFTYDNSGHFDSDRNSRISAMATNNYGTSEQLFSLLPAIYHRYDKLTQDASSKGELQRFLEIFGPQLDFIRSYISSGKDLMDINRLDGSLLSLLAQWIGWQTNPALDLDSQRNDIRFAPHFYRTIGIAANLMALVNRQTDWDCQIKEFHHNVFLSNNPEQLNIWSQKLINGNWCDAELVSLDFAYEGAPSSFMDADGRLWLFYHTKRDNQWDIWYKIFDQSKWSPGYRVTRGKTVDKYPAVLQTGAGNVWLFWSSYDSKIWNIKTKILAVGRDAAKAQLTSQRSGTFELTDGSTLVISVDGTTETTVTFRNADFSNIRKATCTEVVAVLNRDLHSLTASDENGKIQLTSNTAGEGSSLIIDVDASTAASSLGFGAGLPNVQQSDMEPTAFEDDDGHVWLFWSSRREGNWDIWYNKFNGTSWGTEKQLTSGLVPDREPAGVFFDAADPNRKIWVFWCRKGPEGWNIIYRTKKNTDLNDTAWNPEEELSPIPAGQKYDNREPAVRLDSQGNILVFWSSNRTGSWNIWYKTFDKALNNWTDEAPATSSYFTRKAPTILVDGEGDIWLLFRSNKSITYSSKVYPSTTTLDNRYSGSTTIDVRNIERIGEHGKLEDILHYTYNTGKKNEDWYARDTIGIYLSPPSEDEAKVRRITKRLQSIIPSFLPLHQRAVVILNPPKL